MMTAKYRVTFKRFRVLSVLLKKGVKDGSLTEKRAEAIANIFQVGLGKLAARALKK